MPPLDQQTQEHVADWNRALQLRTHRLGSDGCNVCTRRNTRERNRHLLAAPDAGQSKARRRVAPPVVPYQSAQNRKRTAFSRPFSFSPTERIPYVETASRSNYTGTDRASDR